MFVIFKGEGVGMTHSKLRAEKTSKAGQKILFCPVKER